MARGRGQLAKQRFYGLWLDRWTAYDLVQHCIRLHHAGNKTATIQAGGLTQETGIYTAVVTTGSLKMTISPNDAVAAGAQWRVDGGNLARTSGYTVTGLTTGKHTVQFREHSRLERSQQPGGHDKLRPNLSPNAHVHAVVQSTFATNWDICVRRRLSRQSACMVECSKR